MSLDLHYTIEVKKDNQWKSFFIYAKPYKYEESKNECIKIENEDYVKTYIFNKSNWMLRDYLLDSNAWFPEYNLNNKGLPKDISEESQGLLESHKGYNFTNFTLEELNNAAEQILEKYKDLKTNEDIMDFSVRYMQRLGMGNKEEATNESDHIENEGEIEDILWVARHAFTFASEVSHIVNEVENDYVGDKSIRIILWLA